VSGVNKEGVYVVLVVDFTAGGFADVYEFGPRGDEGENFGVDEPVVDHNVGAG
jgi:hypothetical protein